MVFCYIGYRYFVVFYLWYFQINNNLFHIVQYIIEHRYLFNLVNNYS